MNLFKNIPAGFDISLFFIVIAMFVLTVYMGFRCILRMKPLTIVSFIIQLFVLVSGVLTVFNMVIVVPVYEIIVISLGIILPLIFILYDYRGMKKRIKFSNEDVPLIEKLVNKDNKEWRYEEYTQNPEEWKNEIPAGSIIKTLNLTDKQIKTNVTKQLSTVQKLIDNEAYKQALDAYSFLLGIFSDNALIVYNTAWLCYKNMLYEDAIKHHKKALYIIGESPEEKKSNKEESVMEINAFRPSFHFGYGLSLYAAKKFEPAINQFELVQKETGPLLEAEINIFKCYIAIGLLDEAQKHINSALKIKEDNKLRYLLARLCFEKNEEMECKYHLETIVSSDRDFTEAWVLLGQLYRKNRDWENSQAAYKRIIQLTPMDADAYYRLGIAQRESGKTQEALASIQFATELLPEHSRAYYSMASIYDAEGNTEKAIECLNKSLEGDEKLEMAYNLLAEIYISNDKVVEAIRAYEECIREYPESYLAHYNLGVSLMMMKRYEEAVRAFRKAHKITDNDASLYYNWASAVIGLKNYSEAARLYKEGLKLKSDDDEILFGLARVSALSGDVEATLGFLSKAFEINPDLRLRAKASHDFSAYRTLPEFMNITRLPIREENSGQMYKTR